MKSANTDRPSMDFSNESLLGDKYKGAILLLSHVTPIFHKNYGFMSSFLRISLYAFSAVFSF